VVVQHQLPANQFSSRRKSSLSHSHLHNTNLFLFLPASPGFRGCIKTAVTFPSPHSFAVAFFTLHHHPLNCADPARLALFRPSRGLFPEPRFAGHFCRHQAQKNIHTAELAEHQPPRWSSKFSLNIFITFPGLAGLREGSPTLFSIAAAVKSHEASQYPASGDKL
jgi:hypothetical protein